MNAFVRVSVIIPCYNAGEFLARAVQSIVAQDHYGVEIVIVDDGSTDDSAALARSLAATISNVQFVQQANAGPAAARNHGLRRAAGKYVCFLDADDEYAPGCLNTIVPILESRPDLAWVSFGITLVNCDREVHPVQMQAVIGSSPSNLLLRKAAVDLIGGFPEGQAFRGKAGGEDIMLRVALGRWFNGIHIPDKFLRYWVQPGNHLHLFLDRSRVVNGNLVFLRAALDEADGNAVAAQRQYQEWVNGRVGVTRCMRVVQDPSKSISGALEAVSVFDELRSRFEDVPGMLTPLEGMALYQHAKDGPGPGAIVAIGRFLGRPTCWLAAGTRAAQREKVATVDLFQHSPEPLQDGDRAPGNVDARTTLPAFIMNLQKHGLREWVELQVGNSLEISAAWKGAVRLLVITGDNSGSSMREELEAWIKHLPGHGLIALHGVGRSDGMTQLHREWIDRRGWKEIGSVVNLRFVLRKT